MWVVMIISYSVIAVIEINWISKSNEKGKISLYIILMAISCIIGTASGYVADMPSPAVPIMDIVKAIIGS